MINMKHVVIPLLLSGVAFSGVVSAHGDHAIDVELLKKNRPVQSRTPVFTYTERNQNEEWVKPSITKKLEVGQRVEHKAVEPVDKYIVQRLTDRSYWIWSNVFSVTAYVGDESVLLIDAPETFEYNKFMKELNKITKLPISTVVYSHPHVDHVAGTKILAKMMKEKGIDLRVIGSEASVEEINRHKNMVMMPNEVLPNGYSSFQFEGETFKLTTPVNFAHSGADSYIITPDKVAHVVDFFYPGMLPLAQTSGVKDITGYIGFLRHLDGEEWDFANLGHDNIGYKSDLQLTLDYHKDLYNAANKHFPGFSGQGFQGFKNQNTGVMIRNFFDQISTNMTKEIEGKYSHLQHWELAWDHAHAVLWDFALNWDYEGARKDNDIQRAIPDFTPIKPPQAAYAEQISADFPFESKYIDVLGSKMHYIEEGTGDPILFLHGNTTSSYLWRNIIPHVSGQGRAIAPDLIGYGKSDKPNLEYRVFDQIKYVEGFIEEMDLDNITLVIHDWGSAIGLHIAMAHPEKIKAIAMMDAHLKPMDAWDEFADDEATIKGFQAFRTPTIGWDLVTNKNVFMEQLFPSVIKRDLKQEEMETYLSPFPTPESRRPIWRLANDIPVMGQPADTHELFATYSEKLTKSDLPKLLLSFEPGLIIREEQLEWAKTNLKNLDVVQVGDSIHFVQEDDPHGIGRAISNWLNKLN